MRSDDRENRVPTAQTAMPNSAQGESPTRAGFPNKDFIPHPAQFPLRYQRRRFLMPSFLRKPAVTGGDIGLSFHAREYLPAGSRLELEIPLRGRVQRFVGTVVLVRECAEDFEIGLWFATPGDAERARLVEKICHTECTLRTRHGVVA